MAQKIDFAARARAAAGVTDTAPSALIREIESKEHYNFQIVPYGQIIPSKDNKYPMESIEEIKESIRKYGLLHNLVLKPLDEPSGCFRILSGEQRYRAIGLLLQEGDPKFANGVPSRILDKNTSEVDEKIILEEANLKQRNNPQAIREGIQRLNQLYKEKNSAEGSNTSIVNQIASSTGISKRQVQKYNAINEKLIPELQKLFDAKGLNVKEAAELSLLSESAQQFLARALTLEGKVQAQELSILKQQAQELAEQTELLKKQLSAKELEKEELEISHQKEQKLLHKLNQELADLKTTPTEQQNESLERITLLENHIEAAKQKQQDAEQALLKKTQELEAMRKELTREKNVILTVQEKKRLQDLYEIDTIETDIMKKWDLLIQRKKQFQRTYEMLPNDDFKEKMRKRMEELN